MGCEWSKIGTNGKVVPINDSLNQSISALEDVLEGQQNIGSFNVTVKQPVSNVIDHSKQNNGHIVIDDSTNQFIPIPLENRKPLLSDELTKREEIAIVHDAAHYPTPTFEGMSTHETIDKHPSERINSGTSKKRLMSANNQQQANDHHSGKLKDEIVSISDKLFVGENSDALPDTTNDQNETQINNSIPDPTISENLLSKRIDSGISTKHSLSSDNNHDQSNIVDDDIVSISDATIHALPAAANDHVDIVDADPDAFNTLFIKQRQDAIDNSSYRSIIESWQPNSLQQLSGIMQTLSKGKSLIDRHWMVFYWITCNIEYDAVSYLNDHIPNQSEEEVFHTKKGVCAGYSRLYKYLCNQLNMQCEEISGYAKGYGFDHREEDALLKKDHAWNAVEINSHWYLLDSTWGTGYLNKQKTFERKLDCFYFLARPHQMIYHHFPEDDKWQLLQTPIKLTQYAQMPRIRPSFFNFNLELISSLYQGHLSLIRDQSYALVLIRAPNDVELIGDLEDSNGTKIEGGEQVYYDQKKSLWKCKFAPNRDGLFEANIFGKKKSDIGNYAAVISFKIEATHIPSSPLSYPHTGQIFHDMNLKVVSPQNCSSVTWSDNASYVEILIRTPDDVLLSCIITYNNVNIKNGALAQYDNEKRLWQLLFAPECTGQHELVVFAKHINEETSKCALKFQLNVTQLHRSIKFPTVYDIFYTRKCRIYEPLNGVLEKDATVPIHCIIPGALKVDVTVDSVWIETEGYQDPILKGNITIGSKEVTVYAKYDEKSSYDALITYSIQQF